jgi:hypothetical protein
LQIIVGRGQKILFMNKKILFLILLGVLVLPTIAMAQTVEGMITNLINNVVWPVAIGCVVIFWLATGILFLIALGAPEKLKIAKTALFASVAGTVIVVLAASIIAIIRNSLGI